MAKQNVRRVSVTKTNVKNVNGHIILITFIFLFSGCCALKSPVKRYECELARAEEKIIVLTRKFPELIQTPDTLRIKDTLMIPHVEVDTSFVFSPVHFNDTIIIEKERIKIQYVKKDSLIYLSGECIEDTIYIDREIPVEKIVIKETPIIQKAKDWFWILLITIIGGLFARKLIKRYLW